jgi:hypothetical protein
MSFLNVKVGIEGLVAAAGKEEAELLVDTGALYSIVPAGVLRRVDVEPRAQLEFELADGSRIR